MARVRLENVRKVYDGGVVAVHGATFEVEDGEFVVLVGPSGCGKSTTLRMVAGLETVTDGRLWIGDQVVNGVPPKKRDVAMVFQNYALYPHMSVFDNMAFGLKLRKYPKHQIRERVRQAASILGIGDILNRKPRQLSGGQRQRVAVGRAIVRKPNVFLFDEPLSNLDAKLRVQMRTEIARLHRRLEATMLYVTHDQVEAMTLGERIVVMWEGKIQQIDTPLNLYNHPANRFVAGFMGSPSMNFMEGHIVRDDGLFFVVGDGTPRIPLAGNGSSVPFSGGRVPVVLGVRPEDLRVAGVTGSSGVETGFQVVIEVIEPMGNEIVLYTRAGTSELVARVTPQALPEPGSPLNLVFDVSRLHFFDPDSGETFEESPGN